MLPFHLNILPLEKMIPVEKAVSSRIPEIKRELDRTGHLANPLLVSREEHGKYLLLHGINCFKALNAIGIKNAVVQEVPTDCGASYFLAWYHLVRNFNLEYLKGLSEILRLELEEIDYDSVWQEDDELSVKCIFMDGKCYRIIPGSDNLIGQVASLASLIESYQAFSPHLKIYPDRLIVESSELFDLGSALILLPAFSHDQVLKLADKKVLLPPDCLNICVDNRVVGLDFPLRVLNSSDDVEEKKLFLKELLRLRMQSDKSTVYGGKVYFMGRAHREHTKSTGFRDGYPSDSGLYLE
jgi:DNA-binding transcriptional ArsR family regulator